MQGRDTDRRNLIISIIALSKLMAGGGVRPCAAAETTDAAVTSPEWWPRLHTRRRDPPGIFIGFHRFFDENEDVWNRRKTTADSGECRKGEDAATGRRLTTLREF